MLMEAFDRKIINDCLVLNKTMFLAGEMKNAQRAKDFNPILFL